MVVPVPVPVLVLAMVPVLVLATSVPTASKAHIACLNPCLATRRVSVRRRISTQGPEAATTGFSVCW